MSGISLGGQVAIVTGAGRGLGRSHALELARRGAAVVVNDPARNEEDGSSFAAAVVAEIEAAGGRAAASHDSVATPAGGQAIVDVALDRFGTVDILVNNAGNFRWAAFEDMSQDVFESVVDVHLKGAVYPTQPAWRVMQAKGYGRIVMTASNVGALGMMAAANYAAAKGGVLGLTRALALDGDEYGIRVNAVLPAAATSPRVGDGVRPPTRDAQRLGSAWGPMAAADRVKPEWTTAVVAVLASRECPVNGEAFSMVGGRYARVFTGITQGWLAEGDVPRAEDVLAHLDEIENQDGYTVPGSCADEVEQVVAAIARLVAAS